MASADNKRVAKNAVALTLRMVLVTIVGLFTSRIVLQTLGVDDYGIYGVIGGVVGMASFLNSSMAGATSRFITFELGRDNKNRLNNIFSTAVSIHFSIAIFVAILAETVGLWFVNNKMNFPSGSMFEVNVLYQFTIVSMIVGFTQVPYSACIIAHEKMNIYAYFEIINVVLKLGIVYLLLIIENNRLIIYAGLTMALSILTAFIYRLYCIRHFKEAHYHVMLDKKITKEMLSYSGYDLYGNMCVVVKSQGIPIILNIFFGVVANAAAAISATVTGVVKGFTGSVLQAFRPQIIKTYATGEILAMQKLMRRSIQFGLLVYGYIALPVLIATQNILELWLGQVPEYSIIFLRLIIISFFFDMMTLVNNAGIHATGNIKNISFISGSLYLFSPIASWIFLKYFTHNASIVYISDICLFIIVDILGWYFLHKQIVDFKIFKYVFSIIRSIFATFLTYAIVVLIYNSLNFIKGDHYSTLILQTIVCVIINFLILTLLTYLIALSKTEREILKSLVINKFIQINKYLNYRKS